MTFDEVEKHIRDCEDTLFALYEHERKTVCLDQEELKKVKNLMATTENMISRLPTDTEFKLPIKDKPAITLNRILLALDNYSNSFDLVLLSQPNPPGIRKR
jgi:hypothetical protein